MSTERWRDWSIILKIDRAALGGRCQEARPQRVAGEQRGIEADVLGMRLDDIGDRLRGQPRADLAALPDRAKHWPRRDAGGVPPRLQRLDRARDRAAHDGDRRAFAFLVGLAEFDSDFEARLAFLDILAIERHELRSAEGAGKAEQQQGAVANALQAVAGPERHRR